MYLSHEIGPSNRILGKPLTWKQRRMLLGQRRYRISQEKGNSRAECSRLSVTRSSDSLKAWSPVGVASASYKERLRSFSFGRKKVQKKSGEASKKKYEVEAETQAQEN